jgi:hypothetical protein
MDKEHHRLVEELAVWLASWVTCNRDREGRSAPVFRGFESVFQSCCHTLWRLGAALPVDQFGRDLRIASSADTRGHDLSASFFSVLDEAEIRRRVRSFHPESDEAFGDILRTIIGCIYHGDLQIDLTRRWFSADSLPQTLWRALESCGLAERSDHGIRWTESFMQQALQAFPGLEP